MALQDLTPQLRTRLGRVEWFVGLFLGMTALLLLVSFLGFVKRVADARGWFVTEVPYYTYLPDATGIRPGVPVNMMGFKVGEVVAVDALSSDSRLGLDGWDYYFTNNYNVFVQFKVRDPYPGYIGTDSKVIIGGIPVDLAGGVFLDIRMASAYATPTYQEMEGGKPSVLWEKFAFQLPNPLYGFTAEDRTNQFLKYGPLTNGQKGYYLELEQGETLMVQAQRILGKIDSMAAVLEESLPVLTDEVEQSLGIVRRALPDMTAEVQLLLTAARETIPLLTNNLELILGNTRLLTEQLTETIPLLTNSVAQTLVSADALTSTLASQVPLLTSNVNLTLTNLNVLLGRDTNITSNTSLLISNVNHLVRHHWLFRSAFSRGQETGPDAEETARPSPTRPTLRERLRGGRGYPRNLNP